MQLASTWQAGNNLWIVCLCNTLQHSTELNEYLKQLEAEQQSESVYGKGVQLIVPEPSFVIKTKDVTGSHRVYINICTSPKASLTSRH